MDENTAIINGYIFLDYPVHSLQ